MKGFTRNLIELWKELGYNIFVFLRNTGRN